MEETDASSILLSSANHAHGVSGVQSIHYIISMVNDPPLRNSQELFVMEMCGARMVQAADSLLKLVSELKQTAVFSGFASLHDHVDQRTAEFSKLAESTNDMHSRIGEEAAARLEELKCHYYSTLRLNNL